MGILEPLHVTPSKKDLQAMLLGEQYILWVRFQHVLVH